ncbi:glycosyl hydrolase [Amycolatopsis sp. RTGN1]|uniref:glycosyl hydrolase n=1 Tax=Amycolatopsis ponsaeliensis TaxID=2992142 RepID=UPI0025519B26|nr:glycosyl hydrolase [Amycolatopsis sp. RTGN1]
MTVSRRTVLTVGAALGVGATLSWAPPALASGGKSFARQFAKPDASTAAKFRWWWPHGLVDLGEIAREVDQIADAGFGGVEIQDVHHSVQTVMDPEHYGWGTPAWLAAVETALRRAKARGLTVDLAMGPCWPTAVPTITPDDVAASKELAHGVVTVVGSYTGPPPAAVVPAEDGVGKQDLIAVQAALVIGSPTAATVTLDRASVRTVDVHNGQIDWTAPSGTWMLFAYWARGSAQQPEAGPHTMPLAYVVDHFSAAGTRVVLDEWNSTILTHAIRSLLKDVGGDLFEDSLEIETDATIWTPSFLAEFRRRAGYDLLPYLPVVVQRKGKYLFAFDADTSNHVRDDYNQVLSDLYHENHLIPVRDFAHRLGMTLRVQPYGLQTDAIRSAALLDVPESESLGFKNLDDYRVLASGRDMGGRKLLSCESAAYANGAYNTTWDKVLQTMGSVFAGGVNQAVLHGFAYAMAPGAQWPGFAAFSPYNGNGIGYAEAWGPRQPTWGHVPDIAGWFARTQLVLRTGKPQVDIAFYRQKGWTSTGIGAPWATNDGIPAGWTHGFLSGAVLELPSAVVRHGRLAPDGPAYKAMILGGDQFHGSEHTLSVPAAQRLVDFARGGLPTIVIGTWTSDVHAEGIAQPGENDRLRSLITALLAQSTVRVVADATGIPAALAELGVTRDVEHDPSTVMSVHRIDGDTDYYYLCNARHAENRKITAVTQEVWLTAQDRDAVPFVLNVWTGETERLGVFARSGTKVRVSVSLNPGQPVIIALGRGDRGPSAVATDAPEVRYLDGKLVVRASAAGTYSTTLSTGRVARTSVAAPPAPIALSTWDLEVEDWQPGATPTATLKPKRKFSLTALAAWPSIPGLEDVSGVGRYRTTVDLGRWDRDLGAYLDLGEVFDTYRVRVNGTALLPSDVLDTVVDVGRWLRSGRNSIEVEVATTLNNRLRVSRPEVFAIAARQAYGLVGPVRLLPYRQEEIR